MKSLVLYFRVSTNEQGRSGLGLEAQEAAVAAFLGSRMEGVIERYVEIESGKKKDRPQLLAAIERCRRERAVLVIAKLDRLARNVAFIAGLMESGVEFVAADNPSATKFTIHILAAVAEYERDMISKRTREALAAAKARGQVLGRHGRDVLAPRNRQQARADAEALRPLVEEIRQDGATTVRAMAEVLNERGIEGPRGGRWHVASAHRLLQRLGV